MATEVSKPGVEAYYPELQGLGLTLEQMQRYDKFRFWRVVVVASVFYSFYYLGRLNWGIAMPWIIKDLHISTAQAGMGATLLLWSYAVGTLLSGRLGESVGERRLSLIGGVGTTILNAIISFQSGLTAILVPWTVNGFIQAQTYAPINGMISNWYPKARRGFATGIFATSMGLSSIVAWAVTGQATAAFGWRWAFLWPLVALTLPLTLVFYFVSRNKPQDIGLPPYRETMVGIATQTETLSDAQVKGARAWLVLMSNWKFVLACISSFSGYVARYGLLTWIPLFYAQTSGLKLSAVPAMTFALPVGMAFGPVIGGIVSDRFFKSKRWQMVVTFSLLAAITLLIMGFVPIKTMGMGWAVALQVVSGLLVLGVAGVLFTLATDFGGRRLAGTAVGTVNFFNYLGAGIQGIIIGGILNSTGSWAAAWGFCAALLVLSGLFAWIVRE